MSELASTSVEVGAWRIDALSDGFFRLDGGAMWGVVPAALWHGMTPPDERNRIRMALRPFLARRDDHVVVIEPGIGDRWSPKELDRYGIERSGSLLESLAELGVRPEDVTHVIASHCHWDHIGAQVVERDGSLQATFPQAQHFAPQSELHRVHYLDHVRRGSYRLEDVTPVEQLGRLQGFEGFQELLPGLEVHELGGHSEGVSLVLIGEGDDRAVFWSDVVPTTHHIQPPYIMAYDIDVVRSHEQRSLWLERAAAGNWIGLFYHDEHHAFARLSHDGRRYHATPLS